METFVLCLLINSLCNKFVILFFWSVFYYFIALYGCCMKCCLKISMTLIVRKLVTLLLVAVLAECLMNVHEWLLKLKCVNLECVLTGWQSLWLPHSEFIIHKQHRLYYYCWKQSWHLPQRPCPDNCTFWSWGWHRACLSWEYR